jgi:hypothetical protein
MVDGRMTVVGGDAPYVVGQTTRGKTAERDDDEPGTVTEVEGGDLTIGAATAETTVSCRMVAICGGTVQGVLSAGAHLRRNSASTSVVPVPTALYVAFSVFPTV